MLYTGSWLGTNPVPPKRLRKSCTAAKPPPAQGFLSKNSFASLILVARYGLPPRSGWLRSIIVRWALRTLSFVICLSLRTSQPCPCSVLFFQSILGNPRAKRLRHKTPPFLGGGGRLLQGQDQARLPLVHLGLKAAFVEGLPQRANAAARPSPCDKASAPLRRE